MNNDSQCALLNSHLNRSAANIFSVRINIKRTLGLNPHPSGLKILNFRNTQMISAVNRRKQPQEPQPIDGTDDANIKQPVIHLRPRRNLHPAAVDRSIRESR